MVLEKLDCPPGKCGNCCRLDGVLITQRDIDRIVGNTPIETLKGLIETKGNESYLITRNGCPFLKDNACSIYRWRPDTCYLYPTQEGKIIYSADNNITQQMYFHLVCRPGLAVVRDVFVKAMNRNRLLLPNLTIISKNID